MDTSNNTILITGGGSGIGYALAKEFMNRRNKVIIVGRSNKKLQMAKKTMSNLITYACDITSPSDRDDLLLEIESNHNDLNVLINNAGIQYNYSSIEDLSSIDRIRPEFYTNLLAPIELSCLLLPLLLQRESAAVVNVTSLLGIVPKKSAPIYCSSKAGLHIFSKTLRYQLEDTPIRVFEIIPPIVDTDMTIGRGSGKISPEELTEEFMRSFEQDRYEINIGKTKILRRLHRLFPPLAEKMMKNKA